MKTTPLCRILLLAVTLLLGVSAVRFWQKATRIRSYIDRWAAELPVDMQVDFSRPGTFTTTGVFSCPAACGHGMHLYLLLPEEEKRDVTPRAVVEELALRCSIEDKSGREVCSFAVPDDQVPAPYQGQILLGGTLYVGSKTNVLRLTVSRGASALKGTRQRVIGMYDVCGVETLAARVARGLSIACGVLALAFAGALFAGVTKRKNA